MHTGLISALLLLCSLWTPAVWAADEGIAIEETIKEAAMAASTFSESRDKHAVLKLYTKDYVGIQDGETETRESIGSAAEMSDRTALLDSYLGQTKAHSA